MLLLDAVGLCLSPVKDLWRFAFLTEMDEFLRTEAEHGRWKPQLFYMQRT